MYSLIANVTSFFFFLKQSTPWHEWYTFKFTGTSMFGISYQWTPQLLRELKSHKVSALSHAYFLIYVFTESKLVGLNSGNSVSLLYSKLRYINGIIAFLRSNCSSIWTIYKIGFTNPFLIDLMDNQMTIYEQMLRSLSPYTSIVSSCSIVIF
jgi:hypothetical protein